MKIIEKSKNEIYVLLEPKDTVHVAIKRKKWIGETLTCLVNNALSVDDLSKDEIKNLKENEKLKKDQ